MFTILVVEEGAIVGGTGAVVFFSVVLVGDVVLGSAVVFGATVVGSERNLVVVLHPASISKAILYFHFRTYG